MLYVLYNSLNVNEKTYLIQLFREYSIAPYSLLNDFSEISVFPESVILLVNDITKGESALDKKIKTQFGPDFFQTHKHIYRIERPNTFSSDEAKSIQVKQILNIIQKKYLKSRKYSLASFNVNNAITTILNKIQENDLDTTFILDGNLEVRPNAANPTMKNSVTFDEFATMALLKYVFRYNSIYAINVGKINES